MSNWNPNSDIGEDGKPNMDKANYPFWVKTLGECLRDPSFGSITFINDRSADPDDSGKYKLLAYRLFPPHGYVSLGDTAYASDITQDPLNSILPVVFVKEKSSEPSKPYAKKCTPESGAIYRGNVNSSSYGTCSVEIFGECVSGTVRHVTCGYAIKDGTKSCQSSIYGHNWPKNSAGDCNDNRANIHLYRLNDVEGGRYIALGCAWQSAKHDIWENIYAVRSDLAIPLKGNPDNFGVSSNDQYKMSYQANNDSRRHSDSSGFPKPDRCDYTFWSTALIYKDGVKKYLSPFDGWANNPEKKKIGDDDKFFKFLNFYLLLPLTNKEYCCTTDMTSYQCGWGSLKLKPDSPLCFDFYRETCTAETNFRLDKEPNTNNNYCFTRGCKIKPDDSNAIVCDREYSKFCAVQDSTGKYINYEKYPDICACFMPQDFLTKGCNDMSTQLSLQNNKAAMKVLNIDTSDPDQCNQNCAVNPLCRLNLTIPSTTDYPEGRRNKLIVKGGLVDKSKCGDRTVCIQSAVINNEGKVGKISINQQASCQKIKNSNCAQSIFSTCSTANGSGLFTKTLLQEKDQGACGLTNQVFECANFNLTPRYDSCVNGKRILVYDQKAITLNKGVIKGGVNFETTTFDIDENDAVNALTTIINNNAQLKQSNAVASFCKECKMGLILADCQDCILGMESLGSCYLDGNVWKQKFRKSKVIQSPYGGGKACPTTFEEKVDDCSLDKDCKLTISENDQGCIDGVRSIKYNITELNSGNGKTCEDVAMSLVPQIFKDNSPSVKVSLDYKTVETEISCQDCEIGYQIDNTYNNGKCFWDGLKWNIRKIPVYQRVATGGGTCPISKSSLVERKIPIIEQCKADQDCEINPEPVTDVCDDKKGERTLVFNINKMENGKGITCNDLSKEFVKKYDLISSSYDSVNKKLNVTAKCNVSQDCVLSSKPVDSICDMEQGLGVDLYNIQKQATNKGLDCDTVIKSKLNYDVYTVEENGQLYVYKGCEKIDKTRQYIIYGAVGLLILILSLLAIFL
jgi:hypothetical protein